MLLLKKRKHPLFSKSNQKFLGRNYRVETNEPKLPDKKKVNKKLTDYFIKFFK